MKINIIANPFLYLPPNAIGAVEILWYDIARELSRNGHDVTVIGKGLSTCGCDENTASFSCERLKGYTAGKNILWNIVLTAIFDFRVLWRMRKCDILVVNNFWGPIIPALFFFWKYRRLVYNAQRIPKRFFRFYGLLDGICCPSFAVTELAKVMLPRVAANRAVTIPNPIDVKNFNVKVSPRRSMRDGLVIGYHGRVHPEKGLHILAEAVKHLNVDFPELRLLIIGAYDIAKGGGGDEYKAQLDQLAGNLIEWHPPISDRAELAATLAGCHLYCYPSIAELGETFGVSPLEAMGVGVPIVVSALSCFKDFVKDGKTGLVFDHRAEDPVSELASKLELLLSSKETRERIAAEGSKSASGFSNEEIALQYKKWFEELLKR